MSVKNLLDGYHTVLNGFPLERGTCTERNHVLILWMTQFQHVASSTMNAVANRPASSGHM